MSWWPDGTNPTKLGIIKAMFGGPGTAPTFEDDKASEGGEPDWYGEYFGWDNDDKAIDLWRKIYFSDLQKGISALRSGNTGAKYSFISNNCCDVVDKLLETAGAYDGQVLLNIWRSVKFKFAPRDIATIGCVLAGQSGILSQPQVWSPTPEI
jgi:hypothetical protein